MNIGIVGIGKLGSVHLRLCQELEAIKKIYIVDIDQNKLLLYPQFTTFGDFRKLLGKVNAVIIATPTPTHFKIAKFFLENKIPVFVEKPITQNLEEGKKLLKLAKKNKTTLFVGHVERYNNAYLAIKQIAKKPLFIECHRLSSYPNRSLDISVVLDLMIHDLDIILDLVNDKIKKIEAKGVKVLSKTTDIANARLTFKGGCVANITASRISLKKERKIRIFLTNCYISLDYAQQEVQICEKKENQIITKSLNISKEEPLKKEVMHFLDIVKSNSFSLEFVINALNALKLALDIQKIISYDKVLK
ncbi:MAG: Gfo/Idh/MocA family oxidoreductase [Candidatus Omnitrophica bacterium]|nr:Gfo/Idh/MocA family oxidoreductase [Candidatus Omnitrophota bacterium]